MEDIYILGTETEYIPPSSFFNIDLENIELETENEINEITKVSCCSNGIIEEIFKKQNTYYTVVHLNVDIRMDYMSKENNINFHLFSLDKLIYVNIGNENRKDFELETNILDLDIINQCKSKVNFYILSIITIY